MKRFVFILIILSVVALSGCSQDLNKNEIDKVDLIRVLGVDYAKNEYTLTALYSTGTGAETSAGNITVIDASGPSLFEAYENLKLKNKKNLSLAHASFFLIGESLAKNGIEPFISYLSRDETIKMNSLVYITKNMKASKVIDEAKKKKIMIQDDLNAMVQKRLERVTRNDNTLLYLLEDINDKVSDTVIPYLVFDKGNLFMQGYTAMNRMKLIGYLDEDTSLGIDFFKNIVRTCPIYLEDEIGLQITSVKTKLKPTLQYDGVLVKVDIDYDSILRNMNLGNTSLSKDEIEDLKKKQNEYIQRLIDQAILVTRTLNVDVIEIGKVIMQDEVIWDRISQNKDNYLQYINYDYNFESRIARSAVAGTWR
jgi:spore germination protein KC